MSNYNAFEKFIALTGYYSILELSESDIYDSFKKLKENEKYSNFIPYTFDENGRSLKLSSHIIKAIDEGILLDEHNDLLFITMKDYIKEDIEESMDKDERIIFLDMIDDYIFINSKKEEKKLVK